MAGLDPNLESAFEAYQAVLAADKGNRASEVADLEKKMKKLVIMMEMLMIANQIPDRKLIVTAVPGDLSSSSDQKPSASH